MKNLYSLAFATLFLSLGTTFAQIPTDSLLGHWKFDGNSDDISGNINHGQDHLTSTTEDRCGNPDKAYYFDGTNSYVSITPGSNHTQIKDFTISLWVQGKSWNPQTTMGNARDNQYIFDGQSHSATVSSDFFRDGFHVNYKLLPDNSNHVINSTRSTSTSNFVNHVTIATDILNQWHHIVFVRKGSTTYHYFDNQLMQTNINNSAVLDMNHTWFMGTFSGNNPFYSSNDYAFHGDLDDVRIYYQALNSTQVDALFNENCLATSVPIVANEMEWKVFPNPAKDILNIEHNSTLNDGFIEIYNSNGMLILNKQIQGNITQVNLPKNLPTGMYLVKLRGSEFEYSNVKKILIN